MKFKDKDGNEFEDIEAARKAYCRRDRALCGKCDLEDAAEEKGLFTCKSFTKNYPATAARLMGYEVVEEPTSEETSEIRSEKINHRSENINQEVKSEVDTDRQKPLTRFDKIKACKTPEDMVIALNGNERRFCPKSYGAKQPQCKGPCGGCITDWLMEEDKPRFAEEEVADAKVLARALLADGFERDKNGDIFTTSREACRTLIDSRMFPSVRPGQSVRLSEIVGDGNE